MRAELQTSAVIASALLTEVGEGKPPPSVSFLTKKSHNPGDTPKSGKSRSSSTVDSSLGNCHRPTLIQNGAQNGGATHKNCTTLIASAPCRDVCDAEKRRCLFSVFAILLLFS